ncbi:metal-dependent hydrolase [Paenibacillus sp. GCM10012307]|uniref:Metal-dependent hydrolase n=1 Tax=Paenibacillus roseus TaxID=2798579 RepID=A0A934MQY8_9BACL|nr:metal-dependent hydrolase [Paenibacillus roseus]MBJ6363671.1 metal-dependent hydrolase [Paenibacillus roseus]
MNKKGHLSLALAAGSMAVYTSASYSVSDWNHTVIALMLTACAGIGGLAPDIDHKTSTASKTIQFSARKRKRLRAASGACLTIGLILTALWLAAKFNWISWDAWINPLWSPYAASAAAAGPFLLGGGLVFLLLSRLRNLVLIAGGAGLLAAAYLNDWHWIASFAGISLLLLPLVKHRGIIHTPEFALALTIGLLSFAGQQPELAQAAITGFIIGWWTHLAGDCFGSEGIPSLIIPKLKLAMHLFSNGSATEKLVIGICTLCITVVWFLLVMNIELGSLTAGKPILVSSIGNRIPIEIGEV